MDMLLLGTLHNILNVKTYKTDGQNFHTIWRSTIFVEPQIISMQFTDHSSYQDKYSHSQSSKKQSFTVWNLEQLPSFIPTSFHCGAEKVTDHYFKDIQPLPP